MAVKVGFNSLKFKRTILASSMTLFLLWIKKRDTFWYIYIDP